MGGLVTRIISIKRSTSIFILEARRDRELRVFLSLQTSIGQTWLQRVSLAGPDFMAGQYLQPAIRVPPTLPPTTCLTAIPIRFTPMQLTSVLAATCCWVQAPKRLPATRQPPLRVSVQFVM